MRNNEKWWHETAFNAEIAESQSPGAGKQEDAKPDRGRMRPRAEESQNHKAHLAEGFMIFKYFHSELSGMGWHGGQSSISLQSVTARGSELEPWISAFNRG